MQDSKTAMKPMKAMRLEYDELLLTESLKFSTQESGVRTPQGALYYLGTLAVKSSRSGARGGGTWLRTI